MHHHLPSKTSAPAAFRTAPKDPIQVQMHTLSNGLRLFLSVNKLEPRIYTEIAVRAGSKHDPADTTGLAHYFEHMMFKGTDRLGSLDWEREKALLDQIEQTFEAHRAEQDPLKKKVLYTEIDRLSFEAAKYAAANEYDKLVSAMGAKGTNAYTWVEQTVYVNDIPTNELERWFQLESERFRRPVLRLFHTELETVFEEYNISQDRDFRKVMKAMQEVLTPTHPYGTQTTLGRGEDLKNPSQTNIYRFFDRYYVPNNMALVLCGDFDPEVAVALAEQHFGHFQPKPLPPFQVEKQPELTARTQRDVYGNEAPWIEMAWRFGSAKSPEAQLLPLIANVLHNYQAGLFDINLVQRQQVLEAYAYPRIHEDYCNLILHAKPREGQTHAEVERLLWGQIEALRQGDFEDWLPAAVLQDLQQSEIKSFEQNKGRASALTNAFVLGLEWPDVVSRWKRLERVTKADIVDFAQKHLRPDNFVVVYKHTGPDPSVMKVEKPPITPIEVNRSEASGYAQNFLDMPTPHLEPQFLDFKKAIRRATLRKGLPLFAVPDPSSKLFRLHYTFDFGKNADRRLPIAAGYLDYLGTSERTASQVKQDFYRLGVHFSASCQDNHFYFTLSGLDKALEDAVALMHRFLNDLQPNPEALHNLVADILLRRENAKTNKQTILQKAMYQYGVYGLNSPYRDKFSPEQLRALRPEEMADLLCNILNHKHEAFYCGPRSTRAVAQILKKHHPAATTSEAALLPPVQEKKYREIGVRKDRVYFVHFPTVQVELLLLSKGTPRFNLDEFVYADWYNQYFGYGLSSIVFQEIRESKALAYSAYVSASSPSRREKPHFLQAYVGTQPDKLRDAVDAFQSILEQMPVSPSQIETARQSVLRQIATGSITQANIYWTWRNNKRRGFPNHDLRADIYQHVQQARADDLLQFQQRHIKGRRYTWLVLGDRQRVDFKYLRKIGQVEELTLEEVFGY